MWEINKNWSEVMEKHIMEYQHQELFHWRGCSTFQRSGRSHWSSWNPGISLWAQCHGSPQRKSCGHPERTVWGDGGEDERREGERRSSPTETDVRPEEMLVAFRLVALAKADLTPGVELHDALEVFAVALPQRRQTLRVCNIFIPTSSSSCRSSFGDFKFKKEEGVR